MLHNGSNGLVDTTFQVHGVGACGNVLQTYADNRLGENGSGCCAVACIVTGLRGNFLHELCTHVLHRVFEFYLAGHCHTVFGDVGGAELTADNHVAAFGAEGYFHCVGKCVNAFLELVASLYIEFDNLSHFIS